MGTRANRETSSYLSSDSVVEGSQCLKRKAGAEVKKADDTQTDASDIIDLSRIGAFPNSSAESAEQRETRLNELKKKKAERDAERLEAIYEINDRQWRNSDESNARLRDILRSERRSRKSSDSSLQLLLGKLGNKEAKHKNSASGPSEERVESSHPFASGTIGSFSNSLGRNLGIKQRAKDRREKDGEENGLATLAAAYDSDTDGEHISS
ncbi:hypothetical protein LPJ75_002666 [Coemansia sp. RSA 2598]|nr:hypothetical protein LPJ75_002666 [Coemansia sp. RSA 2598]